MLSLVRCPSLKWCSAVWHPVDIDRRGAFLLAVAVALSYCVSTFVFPNIAKAPQCDGVCMCGTKKVI